MRKVIGIFIVLLVAVTSQAEETIRLFMIGNSFSENTTRYLREIAAADGCKVEVRIANIGGGSMEDHWGGVREHQRDPQKGKLYAGRSLQEMLKSEKWDVVTIQQRSATSAKLETYRPHAKNLYDFIKTNAPQAEVRMHQTWAYRADDTGYTGGYSQKDMHEAIRKNFHTIAGELGVTIIPVGEAFAKVRTYPEWMFKRDPNFDYAHPVSPNLPDESRSLNIGARWKAEKFWVDTHHASPLGEYLGSAVFFEALFGKSVVGNSFVPAGISAEDVAFFQQIAHDIMTDEKNINPQVSR
jgi:hypothetical protein